MKCFRESTTILACAFVVLAACGSDKIGTLTPGDAIADGVALDAPGPDGEDHAETVEADTDDDPDMSDVRPMDVDAPVDVEDIVTPPIDVASDVTEEDIVDGDIGPDPSFWTFNFRGIRIPVGATCEEDADCTGERNVCDPLHKVCVDCVNGLRTTPHLQRRYLH